MKLTINEKFKSLIPPLAEDEYAQLESNIVTEGWRKNESIITWNETIIDGHNRYEICSKHDIKFNVSDKKFDSENDVIVWIIDNQLGRRNLLPYDRVRLNLQKEEILKPLAQRKQITHTKQGYHKSDKPLHVLKEIAKLSGTSHNTVAKVKFIESKADAETKRKLSKGEQTISRAYTDLKKKEYRSKIDETVRKTEVVDLNNLNKKYKIIYSDPAWKYDEDEMMNSSVTDHYKVMSIEDLKKLPVNKIADDDCALFIWVTMPKLNEVFDLIKAWGFEYKTCAFTWVKQNKKNDDYFMGLGRWTRANAELCLLATKGKPKKIDDGVRSLIVSHIEEHSKKPAEVRERIVRLLGNLPRIELFARDKTDGWDYWGNEV